MCYLIKHSHPHLTNDQCKFFLFSHDPILRDFESYLGTFIKDQKIANYFNEIGGLLCIQWKGAFLRNIDNLDIEKNQNNKSN